MYSLSPCVYCAYRLFLARKVTHFFKGLGCDESMWHRLQQSGVLAPESVVSTLSTVVLKMSIYSPNICVDIAENGTFRISGSRTGVHVTKESSPGGE